MVLLHIAAGGVALAAGALAFSTYKGGTVHSRSGLVFVIAMLATSVTGVATAIARPNGFSTLNEIAAALTAYLVVTGFLTVQRASRATHWIDGAAASFASVLALVSLAAGLQAWGQRGAPAPAYFLFGTLAALAAVGDIRKFASGAAGARRIARHLWRMGTALLIASAAFFLGQAKVFPEFVRKPALLAIPVFVILFALLYWLARVRLTPHHARVRRFLPN
jgi:uncharacterized membrane protein